MKHQLVDRSLITARFKILNKEGSILLLTVITNASR